MAEVIDNTLKIQLYGGHKLHSAFALEQEAPFCFDRRERFPNGIDLPPDYSTYEIYEHFYMRYIPRNYPFRNGTTHCSWEHLPNDIGILSPQFNPVDENYNRGTPPPYGIMDLSWIGDVGMVNGVQTFALLAAAFHQDNSTPYTRYYPLRIYQTQDFGKTWVNIWEFLPTWWSSGYMQYFYSGPMIKMNDHRWITWSGWWYAYMTPSEEDYEHTVPPYMIGPPTSLQANQSVNFDELYPMSDTKVRALASVGGGGYTYAKVTAYSHTPLPADVPHSSDLHHPYAQSCTIIANAVITYQSTTYPYHYYGDSPPPVQIGPINGQQYMFHDGEPNKSYDMGSWPIKYADGTGVAGSFNISRVYHHFFSNPYSVHVVLTMTDTYNNWPYQRYSAYDPVEKITRYGFTVWNGTQTESSNNITSTNKWWENTWQAAGSIWFRNNARSFLSAVLSLPHQKITYAQSPDVEFNSWYGTYASADCVLEATVPEGSERATSITLKDIPSAVYGGTYTYTNFARVARSSVFAVRWTLTYPSVKTLVLSTTGGQTWSQVSAWDNTKMAWLLNEDYVDGILLACGSLLLLTTDEILFVKKADRFKKECITANEVMFTGMSYSGDTVMWQAFGGSTRCFIRFYQPDKFYVVKAANNIWNWCGSTSRTVSSVKTATARALSTTQLLMPQLDGEIYEITEMLYVAPIPEEGSDPDLEVPTWTWNGNVTYEVNTIQLEENNALPFLESPPWQSAVNTVTVKYKTIDSPFWEVHHVECTATGFTKTQVGYMDGSAMRREPIPLFFALGPQALNNHLAGNGWDADTNDPETLTIKTTPAPHDGVITLEYAYAIQYSGGIEPVVFTLDSGTLPVGTTMSEQGYISGIPNESFVEDFKNYEFTVKATDSGEGALKQTKTQAFTIKVNKVATPQTFVINESTDDLPPVVCKDYMNNFTFTFTTSGGTAPYTWAWNDPQALQGYFSMNPTTGVLAGALPKETAGGWKSFMIDVLESSQQMLEAQKFYSLEVVGTLKAASDPYVLPTVSMVQVFTPPATYWWRGDVDMSLLAALEGGKGNTYTDFEITNPNNRPPAPANPDYDRVYLTTAGQLLGYIDVEGSWTFTVKAWNYKGDAVYEQSVLFNVTINAVHGT